MFKFLKNSFKFMENENRTIILDLLERNPSAKLLDLGCANGEFSMKLARKIGTENVYGIELVNESAKLAEEKGIIIYSTSLNEKIPIESETFDVVHSNQVIEHIYNTDLFIKEIWRILRFDGYSIISTPNLASLHNILSLIMGFQPPTAFVSDEVKVGNLFVVNPEIPPAGAIYPAHAHLRIFSWNALKELFQHHGFKVEKVVGVGYYPFSGRISNFLSKIDGKHSANLIIKVRKVSD